MPQEPKNQIPTSSESRIRKVGTGQRNAPKTPYDPYSRNHPRVRRPSGAPPPPQNPRAPSRITQEPTQKQKTHPEYSHPVKPKAPEVDREKLKAEYKHKQELLQKQQRLKRAAEKERQRQKKQREEALREQKLLEQKREKERRQQIKQEKERQKKYKRELTIEQNRKKQLHGEEKKQHDIALARAYLLRIAACLVLGVILFVASFSAFLVIFNLKKELPSELTVSVGGIETRSSASEFIHGDTVYVCHNDIASLCNFTHMQVANEMKYISPDIGNESVSFIPDSATVKINGTSVRLNSTVFVKDEKLYVPLSFYTDYCLGIITVYDKTARKATIERIATNENAVAQNGAVPIYEPITFTVKSCEELKQIDENILPN